MSRVATLHVRGVPDDLYLALAARARQKGVSITSEAIQLLRRALALERVDQALLIDRIRRTRKPVRPGSPSSAELIREDRER
jgi:plasmid stability protein